MSDEERMHLAALDELVERRVAHLRAELRGDGDARVAARLLSEEVVAREGELILRTALRDPGRRKEWDETIRRLVALAPVDSAAAKDAARVLTLLWRKTLRDSERYDRAMQAAHSDSESTPGERAIAFAKVMGFEPAKNKRLPVDWEYRSVRLWEAYEEFISEHDDPERAIAQVAELWELKPNTTKKKLHAYRAKVKREVGKEDFAKLKMPAVPDPYKGKTPPT